MILSVHIWSLQSCSGFIDEPPVLLLPEFTPEAVHGFLNYVTRGFHQVCSQLNFLAQHFYSRNSVVDSIQGNPKRFHDLPYLVGIFYDMIGFF